MNELSITSIEGDEVDLEYSDITSTSGGIYMDINGYDGSDHILVSVKTHLNTTLISATKIEPVGFSFDEVFEVQVSANEG